MQEAPSCEPSSSTSESSSNTSTVQWVPDSAHTECCFPDCHQKFTFWIRRHHCRQCGLIFCYLHCPFVPLDPSKPPVRVCTLCHQGHSPPKPTQSIDESSPASEIPLSHPPLCDNCSKSCQISTTSEEGYLSGFICNACNTSFKPDYLPTTCRNYQIGITSRWNCFS